jgi:cyclophilin family peptidyl-prolyl cis-trans isomerase
MWLVVTLGWWVQFPLIRVSNEHFETVVVLTLQLEPPVRIRLQLHEEETPDAARYIHQLSTESSCSKCTLYRGEPVPDYWGSPEYPDRFFNGGRWGPPYALLQGGLISASSSNNAPNVIPKAEPHRPIIERGMVAWAGGQGGPHFFIALAQHPEWEHGHTVWGRVSEDDMPKLDALLQLPLETTKPKSPPVVTNFVDPIPFTVTIE